MCVFSHPATSEWKSEHNIWELILTFHHVVSEDQIQVLFLGGDKHLFFKTASLMDLTD